MQTHFDSESAISFLTAAVRIPPEWSSPLMTGEPLNVSLPTYATDQTLGTRASDPRVPDQELWEQQTYTRLENYFRQQFGPESHLLSLGDVAQRLRDGFREDLERSGISGSLLNNQPKRRRGLLDYNVLTWLDSAYFPAPKNDGEFPTSTVVAFKPPQDVPGPPWREYLFCTPGADRSYDELATIYDILGLLAQRRSLLSVSAQRRLCKIVLPCGLCRFWRSDHTLSREYMLVPVVTLVSRRTQAQFRRTLTMTVFLLPNAGDTAPPLDTADLAALCQQAVWSDQSPALPFVVRTDHPRGPVAPETKYADGTSADPPLLQAPIFDGPLGAFIELYLHSGERHLPVVFDAILRKVIDTLGIRSTTHDHSQSVRMLVAISRARSIVFGSVLHVDGDDDQSLWKRLMTMARGAIPHAEADDDGPALWKQLTTRPPRDLAEHVGKLLSVNAARRGREWLIGGDGFQLERMRVTNPYEEDTNAIVLYNPMSRFMVNIMPKRLDRFPTISLKLGVAWLNLLAGTVSSIKEILRSYRYEIEQYRSQIEVLESSDDHGPMLRAIHKTTLTMIEEIDLVYSFDLVTPTYKASHARILEMEGISQEREMLLRELEVTTALLRSDEADQLNRQIARSTSSTDFLTLFVVVFSALSAMLVANNLIDFKSPQDQRFSESLNVDTAIGALAVVGLVVYLCFKYFKHVLALFDKVLKKLRAALSRTGRRR